MAVVPAIVSNLFYIIIAVLVLLAMITIHEFGHYLAGKKLGFKINEFAIGFGKVLYSRKTKSGEIFSLRAVPLGGYCAFEGEDDKSDNKDAFNNKEPWKRLIVLFAGAFFNFVSAIIFAIILLTAYGYDIVEITEVNNDGFNPNVAIIQEGDVIWGVNDVDINFITDDTLDVLLGQYGVGEDITLNITRDGEEMDLTGVQLYQVTEGVGEDLITKNVIGISIKPYAFPFFQAVAKSISFTFGMAWKILVFLGMLITGQIGFAGVGGPITTIGTIATYTQASLAGFLVLLPLIAANLAVFNLLPFPALDGSRMVFVGIEWVRGKPINPKIEGYIHGIGLMILLGFVLFADVFHLLS